MQLHRSNIFTTARTFVIGVIDRWRRCWYGRDSWANNITNNRPKSKTQLLWIALITRLIYDCYCPIIHVSHIYHFLKINMALCLPRFEFLCGTQNPKFGSLYIADCKTRRHEKCENESIEEIGIQSESNPSIPNCFLYISARVVDFRKGYQIVI